MNNWRALVDMRDVSISFGPVQVLNGVNFSGVIHQGHFDPGAA